MNIWLRFTVAQGHAKIYCGTFKGVPAFNCIKLSIIRHGFSITFSVPASGNDLRNLRVLPVITLRVINAISLGR